MSHGTDEELARTVMRLNGMASSFDSLLESVLLELRAMLSVPTDVTDEVVESEFRVVAQRLQRFRPLFDQHCASLLAKHISPEHLPAVVEALGGRAMQIYFPAVREMRAEMGRLSQALAAAMKDIALFEKPGEEPAAPAPEPA